jgi:membrane protein YdbS with pleckstrin-like domain
LNKYTNYDRISPKERKIGQKITLLISFICYICAVISACLAVYFGLESTQTPVFASMLAVTIFFICVAFLLSVLGNGNLPSLKIDDSPDKKIDLKEV